MAEPRTLTIHFTDKTKITARFPKQGGDDAMTLASNVKKALEADTLALEVQGALIVIPMRNVKYIQVTPAPEALPQGVIRNARLVS